MDVNEDLALRLAEVQDALLALPRDAFAEKYELLKEQDRLREQAAGYAEQLEQGRSDAELLAELKSLRGQMKALASQKINLVSQAGGGSHGPAEMGNVGAFDINRQMMQASGADQIRARIGRITSMLAERGVEVAD